MKYQGTVVTAKHTYGFVFCRELNRRVFYHVGSVNGPDPKIGDSVTFELAASRTPGQPDAAVNVTPVGGA
jgi:hypothetical protein